MWGVLVVVDVDLGEERLVAQSSRLVVAGQVELVGVRQQVERLAKAVAGRLVVAVLVLQALGDRRELGLDAPLVSLENGDGHRAGEVGVEQLVLLCLQPTAPVGQLLEFLLGGRDEPVEVVGQRGTEPEHDIGR
ncbi:MAG TPA: hypothetical protein VGC04_10860 [Cellulomonas sp.]